jgi:hypothetical protein
MLFEHPPKSPCRRPMARREFLCAGSAGMAGLTLADLLRVRAESAPAAGAPPASGERTALILVWLPGGASHLETYDPKPRAPNEYRGPFAPIRTKAPGLVVERRVGRGDFLATMYRHLGIDASRVAFRDFAGRPIPILHDGSPIPELVGRS